MKQAEFLIINLQHSHVVTKEKKICTYADQNQRIKECSQLQTAILKIKKSACYLLTAVLCVRRRLLPRKKPGKKPKKLE